MLARVSLELMEKLADAIMASPVHAERMDRFISLIAPEPKKKENPSYEIIRRINWERRVKALKRDWYGRKK